MTEEEWLKQLFEGLSRSSFRRRFHLKEQDREYVRQKGMDTIRQHAWDFIEKRLAPAVIPNDGKQTPMRGHPVFIAQHATAELHAAATLTIGQIIVLGAWAAARVLPILSQQKKGKKSPQETQKEAV